MKTQIPIASRTKRHDKGFALVVTLSLMILLTVIAVGLLGLSSVSLRTSSQQVSMSEARANARLALMLALGDLQKHAGPDQRITATADILTGTNAGKNKYTGVWESNKIVQGNLPTASDYQASARDDKFKCWLASSNGTEGYELKFNKSKATDLVELWSTNTVGTGDKIEASRIKMTDSKGLSVGRFAYAVTDEGVKARINTPIKNVSGLSANSPSDIAAMTSQLGAGQRASSTAIDGLDALSRENFKHDGVAFEQLQKGITRNNYSLAANSLSAGFAANLKPRYHDVTTLSSSVLANVATGELKRDFNLMANSDRLPSEYAGRGVYSSVLGISGPSDPRWESLHDIAKLSRNISRLNSTSGSPILIAGRPPSWLAATGSNAATAVNGVLQKAPPSGAVLMPSIVKVQMMFSLTARDIYDYPRPPAPPPGPDSPTEVLQEKPDTDSKTIEEGAHRMHASPWGDNFAGSKYDYLLNLIYMPIVTLHNPYNVTLQFNNLKVVFANVPFGMQVFRNGIAQTNSLIPLDRMYTDSQTGDVSKRFGMSLRSAATGGSPVVRLLPGEVKVFTPFINPSRTYRNEFSGGGGNNKESINDWYTKDGKLLNIEGVPGMRSAAAGYSLDWLCGDQRTYDMSPPSRSGGVIPLKSDDKIRVLIAPISRESKFTFEAFVQETSSAASQVSMGALELDYGSPKGLQDAILGAGETLPSPDPAELNITEFGMKRLHQHSSIPIGSMTVEPLALLTLHAKTTSGGVRNDSLDGRFYAKPWAFAHAPIAASSNKMTDASGKITKGAISWGSHEADFVGLNISKRTKLLQSTASNRSNFITGFTGETGLNFGAMYDIPFGPLQSLASLNTANPGGSSGYLPRFAHPIGNSWAHPLLKTDAITATGNDGLLMDHSYLLNRALYDHFYFSGLGDRSGRFGDGTRPAATLESWIRFNVGETTGKPAPLNDPRLVLYKPDGQSNAVLEREFADADFYQKIASWQMLEGGFNINSTSVNAWKAMLSSVNDPYAIFNQLNLGSNSSNLTRLENDTEADKRFDANKTRISRFRLPVASSGSLKTNDLDPYWLAPREFTEAEIQNLAEKIVDQVKLRGPFLSLSDFVNRPIGGDDELNQMGALQKAIDLSELNKSLAEAADARTIEIKDVSGDSYNYANPAAAAGSSHQGAPGYLTQADILSVLGNAATPRSDTFTIRGYGEARNKSDQIVARATCEAVVQRVPDYLDSADLAHIPARDLTSATNRTFGRKFVIVSFRWLNSTEV